jgi:hypothetical protein
MAGENSSFYDEVVNKGKYVGSGYEFSERYSQSDLVEDWTKNAWYYQQKPLDG